MHSSHPISVRQIGRNREHLRLNRCRLQRARAGPSRDERICAKHAQRRERPSPSSRPQCRQYGCRDRPAISTDSSAECHGRCTPGRRRSVRTGPSTTGADDAVDRRRPTTRRSGGDRRRRPGANRAQRRPPSRTSRPPGSREWRVLTTSQETRQVPRPNSHLRGVAGLPCQGLSSGQAPVAGDVREYRGRLRVESRRRWRVNGSAAGR